MAHSLLTDVAPSEAPKIDSETPQTASADEVDVGLIAEPIIESIIEGLSDMLGSGGVF